MSGDQTGHQSMEQVIREYVNREVLAGLELPPIKDDTQLVESGVLDSLSILRLVLFIEERYSLKIAPDEVVSENFETVEAICKFVRSKITK
jgi:acyl carrier protein